jgi:hypothetical protein
MTSTTAPRRYPPTARSFLLSPHVRVGETLVSEVQGGDGVMPHRSFRVMTACGLEVTTTLATRDRERTHCQACYDATGTE